MYFCIFVFEKISKGIFSVAGGVFDWPCVSVGSSWSNLQGRISSCGVYKAINLLANSFH